MFLYNMVPLNKICIKSPLIPSEMAKDNSRSEIFLPHLWVLLPNVKRLTLLNWFIHAKYDGVRARGKPIWPLGKLRLRRRAHGMPTLDSRHVQLLVNVIGGATIEIAMATATGLERAREATARGVKPSNLLVHV